MNPFLLGFSNKEERNDFLIALVVILFFAWIIYFFLFRGSTEKTEALIPQTEVALIPDSIEQADIIIDSDEDGIADAQDRCPELAGVRSNKGCPSDQDRDGVYDADDQCPNQAGLVENKGCPKDSDGDGIFDKDDQCPNKAGLKTENGCPKIKLTPEETAVLQEAIETVNFETGTAFLTRNGMRTLKKITPILVKYPDYKLSIAGHTDNVGNPDKNLQLSQERAKACYNYFIDNNIEANRLQAQGYGDQKPVASNNTPEGRSKNRRVEFRLQY